MSKFKNHLLDIKQFLFIYIKQPIHGIKALPNWEWDQILLCHVIVTAVSGALSGLLKLSISNIFYNVIATPLISIIPLFISSLFFFYTFQLFTKKVLSFKSVFEVVFFANIPFFIFFTINNLFPPIIMIGMAFTALLLIVGFVENFQLDKKFTIKLVGAIYLLLLVTFIVSLINNIRETEHYNQRSYDAPEVQLGK